MTDPREQLWLEWEAKQLARGLCPHSGEALSMTGEGIPGSASCEMCDCFGFDPEVVAARSGAAVPVAAVYAGEWEKW
jgi:hypothetical protein